MTVWTQKDLVKKYNGLTSDKLMAELAHDIKNRLNAAVGYTEIIHEDLSQPEQLNIDDVKMYIEEVLTLLQHINVVVEAGLEVGKNTSPE